MKDERKRVSTVLTAPYYNQACFYSRMWGISLSDFIKLAVIEKIDGPMSSDSDD